MTSWLVRLRLVNGFLEFSFSLGVGGPLTLLSPVPLTLGHWHTLKAHRYHQVYCYPLTLGTKLCSKKLYKFF